MTTLPDEAEYSCVKTPRSETPTPPPTSVPSAPLAPTEGTVLRLRESDHADADADFEQDHGQGGDEDRIREDSEE